MKTSDYKLPAHWLDGLTDPQEEHDLPRRLLIPGGLCVDDLKDMPTDAQFANISGKTRNLRALSSAQHMLAVYLDDLTDELVKIVADLPSLRAISLRKVKTVDLRPLVRCQALEHLAIFWAPHLSDISFLAKFTSLRTLGFLDIKRLDLDTLPELPGLISMHCSGGFSNAQRIRSFEPFTRLHSLRHLKISNIRPEFDALKHLHQLTELQELSLSNFFEVEDFAKLSAALPNTRGAGLSPIYGNIFSCEICGSDKVMLTGKPANIVCPVCDIKKYQKRLGRWNAALQPSGI